MRKNIKITVTMEDAPALARVLDELPTSLTEIQAILKEMA